MNKTRKLTTMSVMTALSVILVAMIHFPIFPAVAFLEYDPADVAILICGFAFGPGAGIAVTLVASLIQGITVSAQSGIYGIIMHVLATGVYVTVASLIYTRRKTKKMAAVALIAGSLAMTVTMFGANLLITPYFMMGAINAGTIGVVLDLMPFILLFNLIKSLGNGVITFLLYKHVKHFITHVGEHHKKEAHS